MIFEPADSNVKLLNDKFSRFPNVTVEQAAVSNEIGDATLYSNEDGSGLASLTKRRLDHFGINFENTESVKTLRFQGYWKSVLNSQQIDICKIDIEGHELDALAGSVRLLNISPSFNLSSVAVTLIREPSFKISGTFSKKIASIYIG